jgi:hypothetical protein
MEACPTASQHEQHSIGLGFARPVSPACSSLSRRSPEPSASSCRRCRPRPTPHRLTSIALSSRADLARRAVPYPTARRSLMTRSRVWPNLNQLFWVPYAKPQLVPRPTGSSSSSTVAGVPRSTRNSSSSRRSRSTAQNRKLPDGWPPPTRLLTCRGTRSTSGTRTLRRGCPYGLCQIYSNEPWHYELRPEASNHGCPRLYADPTHDPRMQQ